MNFKNLCPGYKASLKHAIEHTRKVLAIEDDCPLEEVGKFHPDEEELVFEQKDLFKDLEEL